MALERQIIVRKSIKLSMSLFRFACVFVFEFYFRLKTIVVSFNADIQNARFIFFKKGEENFHFKTFVYVTYLTSCGLIHLLRRSLSGVA